MTAASTAAADNPRRRIDGIDTARALAIALAMLSHCFIHFGVWELLSDQATLALRSLTRSATPTFIVLFGMMLEIVYLKLIRRGERQGCWVRLVARAIQCYLLYLLVVAAGILGGNLTPRDGLLAALFLSEAYFANILKFYSLGLLCGIGLLELRARYGLRALALVFAAVWLAWPLIKALPPLPAPLSHLASFLVGAGAETGPSVLQGMTLAALGMLLGHGLLGLRAAAPLERRDAGRLLLAVTGLLMLAFGALAMYLGAGGLLAAFTSYAVRAANHPIYYIVGSGAALLVIGGCIALAGRLRSGLLAGLNVFGVSSLFAYGIGNVILNLLPALRGSLALGLAASLLFLAGLYGLTAYFQQAVRSEAAAAGPAPAPSLTARLGALHELQHRSTVNFARLLVRPLLARAKTA